MFVRNKSKIILKNIEKFLPYNESLLDFNGGLQTFKNNSIPNMRKKSSSV
ncbi:2857_t:CDS:2 [Cetraspora pellucida]|uniref:2857_t:CDS:1 n=1 Tax=Cetraspora pellucida TaxID=1433469 RepID=A0A9N9GXV8_9GLOM|nr:2857_t:CDS:2 [Cetraspora pellucida]